MTDESSEFVAMKDKCRLVWETHHLAVMAGLARRLIVRLFSQLHGPDENNLLDSLSLDLVDPRQFPVCR
jgi:hypothetical protein